MFNTHMGRGEVLKETDSGIYQKGQLLDTQHRL